jgi:hypothetical protein
MKSDVKKKVTQQKFQVDVLQAARPAPWPPKAGSGARACCLPCTVAAAGGLWCTGAILEV